MTNYLTTYINHPAAAKFNGKSILTTFSGSECGDGWWSSVMGNLRDSLYWMPTFNVDPTTLPGYAIDAEVNWGSAWPSGGSDIETSRDVWYMQQLGSKGYVGTISPLFYAHLSDKVSLPMGSRLRGRTSCGAATTGCSACVGSRCLACATKWTKYNS